MYIAPQNPNPQVLHGDDGVDKYVDSSYIKFAIGVLMSYALYYAIQKMKVK